MATFHKELGPAIVSFGADWKDIGGKPSELEDSIARVVDAKKAAECRTINPEDTLSAVKEFINEVILNPFSLCVFKVNVLAGATIFQGETSVESKNGWRIEYGDGNVLSFGSDVTRIPPHTYSAPGEYTIRIHNARVSEFGDSCFSGCEGLVSIEIPGSVGSLGNSCFKDCTALTKVSIPESVTKIGSDCFSGCTAIDEIEIPPSVRTLGSGCFANCTNLLSLCQMSDEFYPYDGHLDGIPKDSFILFVPFSTYEKYSASGSGWSDWEVRYIQKFVFNVENGTTVFQGPSVVETSVEWVIKWGDGTTQVIQPDVQSIPSHTYALSGTYSMTIRKATLREIGELCFHKSAGLNSVEISGGVLSIGNYAFSECPDLGYVKVPDTVESIGVDCFSGCNGLEVDLFGQTGRTVDSDESDLFGEFAKVKAHHLNDFSFANVTSNKMSVEAADGIDSVGEACFYNCTGLVDVKMCDGLSEIGQSAFFGCTSLAVIDFPQSLEVIGQGAFENCNNLNSVLIPLDVSTIGVRCFKGCSSLKAISVDTQNETFDSRERCNAIIETETDTLMFGCRNSFIPESVSAIGESAFDGIDTLQDIYIPFGVESLEDHCFRGCSSIENLKIQRPTTFGSGCLEGCDGLRSLTLVNNVKYEYPQDFLSGVPTGVDGCVISVLQTLVAAYKDDAEWSRWEIGSIETTSATVVTVSDGTEVFSGQSSCSLTDNPVVIWGDGSISCFVRDQWTTWKPDGTSESVFGTRESLPSHTYAEEGTYGIELANGTLKRLEEECFSTSAGLQRITIPSNVDWIGDACFSNCDGLHVEIFGHTGRSSTSKETDLFGPNATVLLHSGDDYILYRVSSQNLSVITDSVERLGRRAVAECKNLTSALLGSGLVSIGQNCFDGDVGLTGIIIPESVSVIENNCFFNCSGLVIDCFGTTGRTASSTTNDLFGSSASVTLYGVAPYVLNNVHSQGLSVTVRNCERIGDYAFSGCRGLDEIVFGDDEISEIGNCAFRSCSSLRSVSIPNTIRTIGDESFYGCTSLNGVTIPESVEEIGDSCFGGCNGLSVTMNGTTGRSENEKPSEVFGKNATVLITHDTERCFFENVIGTGLSVQFSNSVRSIGDRSFFGCTSLESLTIPAGVRRIGINSFSGCSGLRIELFGQTGKTESDSQYDDLWGSGATVTVHQVPDFLMANVISSNLHVVIGSDVPSLGVSSFSNCSGIHDVLIPENIMSIGKDCFRLCNGVTFDVRGRIGRTASSTPSDTWGSNAVVSIRETPDYFMYNVSSPGLTVHIASGDIIGYKCFSGCSGLKTVSVSQSLQIISEYGFENCSSLIAFTCPASLKTIKNNAFSNCGSLAAVSLNDGLSIIGVESFSGCSSLREVTIPSSVTSIGKSCFAECDGIAFKMYGYTGRTQSDIGNTTTGDDLFGSNANVRFFATAEYECVNVISAGLKVEIAESNGITAIPASMFRGCIGIVEAIIPGSVSSIGGEAFYECTSLERLSFEEGLKSIGKDSFRSCISIRSIELPSSLVTIGENSFRNCSGVGFVDFNNGVSELGASAFEGCSLLNTVSIPGNVKRIGNGCFKLCKSLERVEISEGVEVIGNNGFSNCESLLELNIPSTVSSLNEETLTNDISLKKLVLPHAEMYSYARLFMDGVPDLTTDHSCEIYVPEKIVQDYSEDDSWKRWIIYPISQTMVVDVNAQTVVFSGESSVGAWSDWIVDWGDGSAESVVPMETKTVPSHIYKEAGRYEIKFKYGRLERLGRSCFENCTGLNDIVLPHGIVELGASCFKGCSNLTDLGIADDEGQTVTYKLPQTIASFGESCFKGCSSLERIHYPSSLTSIGKSCFESCSSFETTDIPSGISALSEACFKDCVGLNGRSIAIPQTIVSIGKDCYSGCSGLTFELDGKTGRNGSSEESATWGSNAVVTVNDATDYLMFKDISDNLTVMFGDGVQSLGNFAFAGCSGLSPIAEFPASIASIGKSCFKSCVRFNGTAITLHEGISYVGDDCFAGCHDLAFDLCGSLGRRDTDVKSNVLGDSEVYVRIHGSEIPDICLYNVTNESMEVVLDEDATEIGIKAFAGCTGLNAINIPNTIETFGAYCFAECEKLSAITIPDGVTVIPNGMMSGCTSLSAVQLHEGIESLGEGAFKDCPSLVEVKIPESVESMGPLCFYGCTGLRLLELPRNSMYEYTESLLEGVHTKTMEEPCRVHVPSDLLNDYHSDEEWDKYLVVKTPIPFSVTLTGASTIFANKVAQVSYAGIEYIVNWGDGSKETCSSETLPSHRYASEGQYEISVDGVDVIGFNANCFSNNKEIESIVLPEELLTLGTSCFSGCTNLKSVSMKCANGNTVIKIIPQSCFEGCSSLQYLTVKRPNGGVQEIPATQFLSLGAKSFKSCPKYTGPVWNYTIRDGDPYAVVFKRYENYEFKSEVFSGCTSMSENFEDLMSHGSSFGVGAFENCPKIYLTGYSSKEYKIPAKVISERAFAITNTSLKSEITGQLLVEGSITLAKDSFKGIGCTRVHLNSPNYTAHEAAFSSCSSLKSITLDQIGYSWRDERLCLFPGCLKVSNVYVNIIWWNNYDLLSILDGECDGASVYFYQVVDIRSSYLGKNAKIYLDGCGKDDPGRGWSWFQIQCDNNVALVNLKRIAIQSWQTAQLWGDGVVEKVHYEDVKVAYSAGGFGLNVPVRTLQYGKVVGIGIRFLGQSNEVRYSFLCYYPLPSTQSVGKVVLEDVRYAPQGEPGYDVTFDNSWDGYYMLVEPTTQYYRLFYSSRTYTNDKDLKIVLPHSATAAYRIPPHWVQPL